MSATPRALPLVDFLAILLETQASVLSRLALKFDIENLIELLESVDDGPNRPRPLEVPAEVFAGETAGQLGYPPGLAYQRLEGAVRSFDLPEQLEFYLWAYPFYRSMIEGPFPLDRPIRDVQTLIRISIEESKRWLATLPMSAPMLVATEKALEPVWIQFRAQTLEKAGFRRLGAL